MHRTRTLRGPLQGPHATSWDPGSKEHVLEIKPEGGGRNSPGRFSKAGFAPRKFSGNIRVPVWGGAVASLGKTRRSGLDDGSPRRGEAGRRDRRGADRARWWSARGRWWGGATTAARSTAIRWRTPRSWRSGRRRRRPADGGLSGCTMYVTLEPCAMCAGALVNSRVERLVYGAPDPKAGYCGTLGNLVQDPRLNHRLEVTAGVLESESAALLRGFFASLRRRRGESGQGSLEGSGEMSEWLKEHAWKACVGETLPWVRIPLSPPRSRTTEYNRRGARAVEWDGLENR